MQDDIEDIHQFWFGALDTDGFAPPDRAQRWFRSGDATDSAVRQRFGALVARALAGELDHWAGRNRGLIALVLLLDQFTRNIYRDTPRAFAGDSAALALARDAIASERHLALPAIHRVFLYLPLEHHEDLATQDECLRLYAELADTAGAQRIESYARYARAHREVIARFGRFPHRNAVLGRVSSAAESDYLAKHGGF